jgi:8-oxo-dGTP diphosphatase
MEKIIDKIAFIHLVDGKILMSLSRGKDTWYIPGGKREAGESDEACLLREVEEELSVKIVPDSIKKYGVFEAQAHGHPHGLKVRMTCYMAEFNGGIKAAAEIEKIDFFPYSRKSESSAVDHLIFDDLKSKGLLL